MGEHQGRATALIGRRDVPRRIHARGRFLFRETDLRLFETYSAFGAELREFHSFEDVSAAFDVGADEHGSGAAVMLALWSPSVMENLEIERITLDPTRCQEHTFRYAIKGWGLIQLHLGGVHGRVVTASYLGHNSEKRARAWGHAESANWARLTQLSNRIQYVIRRRFAVAMVPGRPVLPEAYNLARSGYALKELATSTWRYPPPRRS